MPGRFSNLEFEEEKGEARQGQRAARTHDSTASDHLSVADEECRWGYFESALRLYTRALHEDRSAIPAWIGQVRMLVQLDECREARLWSDKALELFRNNGDLLAAKAQACIRLNDFKAGLACSDASLQAPGSSPWRWQVRGEALLAKGQKHYGECFEKSLAEATADWFDRVVIARILFYHHRVTSALNYLKEAVEIEPAHGYIWLEMGHCQKALALDALATCSYERCLELRPDCHDAQEALDELVSSRSFSSWMGGILRRWRRG